MNPMDKYTAGAAYPTNGYGDGMTILDAAALAALQGILSSQPPPYGERNYKQCEALVHEAYNLALAFTNERRKVLAEVAKR